MPRKARSIHNTKFFHVMAQGINREYIFQEEIFKRKYLKLLQKTNLFDIKMIAYCLMDNHAHLLIHTENAQNMSDFMKNVNFKFAMYYNNKKDRVGTVFRDRYKAQPIYSEKSLRLCIAYIHNNPVKAKIVNSPEDYLFSSYKDYVNGNIEKEIFAITFESNLILFKEEHKNNINEKFIEYQGEKEDVIKIKSEFLSKIHKKTLDIHGDKELIKELILEIKERCNASNAEIARELGISKITVGRYLKK